ncbi:NnrU family protein [Allosediminivita pacifica]|uniref:Putative membrane protein n=1 Tax=Allosediminivita pacifica TaxID=1267769 RepID=A0A2T6BA31_9RHOB|nr:NnrU family protein [Allosediminivita pacifica]PTX52927.1 putative membrane protein [Allosediminivita pacifica]GGA94495.1 membrane protein [Allosediminivita pacifica]
MSYLVLIIGVALWSGAHLFKRLAPARRAAMGGKAKGLVALALVVAIVLMVIGYRGSYGPFFWGRHPATVGINNLLMLLSVYLFAASGMKTYLGQRMRHPQLIAVKTWSLAHILVNGDLPSFILFGGLMAWAVVEVILINKQTTFTKPAVQVVARKEIIAVVATLVVYGAIAGIHYALGYPAFG